MMETDEPPVASSNIATPKAGSVHKDKKKKLKAVYRKRHHGLGNLSIRNSTLNSTIFKASLKINNRALAQALEKKKSECRAAEAFILQQKEEIQLLTAEVNKAKMFAEKTKRFILERLQTVSGTMQLAVEQLFEAMDACTDGEFRKQSGPFLLPAVSTSVVPSVNEQISLKPVSNVVVRPAAGPSRVTVSAAAAATAACDDDEDQDVVASMDQNKEPAPCDGPKLPDVASSNLSIIMEQSYLVPNETDLAYDEPVLGYQRSNSRDRRNAVVFQPSMADSPAPADEDNSKQDVCVRGKARSRSRHSFDLSTGEMNMLQDAGITRSKSRDRRNAIIFHPSSAESPDEDRGSAGKCVRILRRSRNPSGQNLEASAVKIGRFEDSQASGESPKLKESVAVQAEGVQISGGEEVEQSFLDETLVAETEVLSSEMIGQLSLLQNLAKSSKVSEGIGAADGSMELVEETIIMHSEESSCVTEAVLETDLSQLSFAEELNEANVGVRKHAEKVGESLTGNKISHGIQQKSGVANSALAEEADGLVNRGEFVTRDKISRTPVKVVKHFREGEEGSVGERANLSDISDRESYESEYRRSRSLSRRDIPTFMPIDSPSTSDTTPGMSKGTVSAAKGQAKSSKFLKTKGIRKDGTGPSELKERKKQNKPGLINYLDTDTKGDVVSAARHATENAQMSRRGTFALPKGGIPFLEGDIMMEDDSVLINESSDDFLGTEDDVFVNADQLPRDEGRDAGSNQVASPHVEHPSNVLSQNALTEKNLTILMAEDMEQTGVSFSAISITDPPAAIRPLAEGDEANNVGESGRNCKVQNDNPNSPEKQSIGLDELALGEKRSKLPTSCSESVRAKTTGKNRKVNNKETACSNETEARDESAEDDMEPTSNVVKRRRVAHSKLKLPGSGVAAAGTSSDKGARSPPRDAATKKGTVFDNPAQSLANCNRKRAEAESEGEEIQEQSMDIEMKKRFAAYLSKPGNIVFNADRKDMASGEVAKKTRSKSRSILPLQQKPRSKASATSAKPEDEGTASVWDFKGTPRLALAKENADRLLSVYDISLNDSGVIPKPKQVADPVQCPKKRSKAPNEFSKDDSFIADKKLSTGKRRVRHESASAIDCLATFASGSENAPKAALESPHGIMLVLGNGKRRKPSARSKTVRYEAQNMGQIKADTDQGKTSSLLSGMSKDATGSQPALNNINSTTESDLVSKLIPAGAETAVTVENPKEPSTQQAVQVEINHDKLVIDIAKDCAEEKAERISAKDVRLKCEKSKDDGLSHSVKDVKNPESHNSKEITHKNRAGRGTVKKTDNVVAVNDKNAAANVKGSDAGKKGKSSVSAKGKDVVNPKKEITKDDTNSKKGCKKADSKGGTNFSPLCKGDVTSSDTASNQSLNNFNTDQTTVLFVCKEQTSESDRDVKSALDSARLQDSLTRREPSVLGVVTSDQKLDSLHVGNAEQQNETESPQVAVQKRARKRRVIQSTDMFEDIDAQSLHSPKSKQPALAEEKPPPVTFAGAIKTLLKPDNHHQVDSPTTRRSQKELPKLQGPGNARRDHNSLRLRKNPKATSTKTTESSNVPEMAEPSEAVFRQLVTEQPLGLPEKTSDKKKKSLEKDSSAVPPRRRTNLSTKNAKEKTSQRKSDLPKEECVLAVTDTLQANGNLAEAHKDLDLHEDKSNEDKSKKKRSVIQSRQSSISIGSCDTSSHSEMADRRTRRNAAQAVSYKEPSLGKKLRRGDPHTSTIYGGANPELEKHGSERTSDARLSRKVLSTVENTSMETE